MRKERRTGCRGCLDLLEVLQLSLQAFHFSSIPRVVDHDTTNEEERHNRT